MTISIRPTRAAALAVALLLGLPGVAAAQSKKPDLTTGRASAVGETTVTLNGSVTPNGAQTTYRFQYGLDRLYGGTTAVTAAGNGEKARDAAAAVTALAPATTYHYRIVAQNRNGLVFGKDRTFKTRAQPLGLVLSASPATVRYQGSTTLTGVLSGTGNAGAQVVLQSNPWPYTQGFANVGNALVTDAAGGFSFPILAVLLNTQYRVVMPEKPAVVSPLVSISVVAKVTGSAKPKTIRRGKRVNFSGRITPAVDGQQVAIQKLISGNWTTVTTTVARTANGLYSTYRRRMKVKSSGRFRVAVPLIGAQYAGDVGKTYRVKVRPRKK